MVVVFLCLFVFVSVMVASSFWKFLEFNGSISCAWNIMEFIVQSMCGVGINGSHQN